MNLETFFRETYIDSLEKYASMGPGRLWSSRPMIVCADDFSFSAQGSYTHYCNPKMTQEWYESVELGFPSEVEELLLEYAEEPDTPTDSVYGYVPVDVLQKVIDKHGGIDVLKTITDEYDGKWMDIRERYIREKNREEKLNDLL